MRLFFGLPLPPDVRACVAQRAKDAQRVIPGRYTLAENYHITLAFLGEVPPDRLADACGVLARCVAGLPAPVLSPGGLAYFGRAQNAILTLRVHSDPPLEPLHDALVRALHGADLPADPGPFSPHITLARHAVLPDALPAADAPCFCAREAHVYLSARDGENVLRYTPVASASFAQNGNI